jgi:hypothetical protein
LDAQRAKHRDITAETPRSVRHPMTLRSLVLPAMLSSAATALGAENGLTMSVYNNSAWYGEPLSSKVVDSFDQSLPLDAGVTAMSVEITGSLTYPPNLKPCFINDFGCYTFNCSFGASTYGFLWFDDHLVCQHGAYVLHPDSYDGSAGNPLRVLSKKTVVVRLQAYLDPANPALPDMDARRAAIESNELELRPPTQALPPSTPSPPQSLPPSLDFTVKWMQGFGTDGPITPPEFKPIDSSLFSPTIAPAEQTRVTLQQNLTDGWGTWANSVLDLVLMPEGARITVGLCQISSGKCITSTRPSDTETMRVAEHAYDKTFVRMFLTFRQANVSVEFSSGTGDQASKLDLALTPLNCDDASGGRALHVVGGAALDGPTVNCSDFTATVMPSWAWGRAGTWEQPATDSLTAQASGLRSFTLHTTSPGVDSLEVHPAASAGPAGLTFALDKGGGLSTQPNPKFSDIVAHMTTAHTAVHAKHEKYGDLSEVANAVQSAVMWCLLYVPSELGPFAPVSRSWAFLTPARAATRTDEWVYVIFDWDNIFASYLFALDARDFSYSNLIQVIRSKTAQGFIANFASAGQKSLDRTEPMIGAKVVLEVRSASLLLSAARTHCSYPDGYVCVCMCVACADLQEVRRQVDRRLAVERSH